MYECIVLCCLFDCRFGKITEWGPGGETVEVQESVSFHFLIYFHFTISLRLLPFHKLQVPNEWERFSSDWFNKVLTAGVVFYSIFQDNIKYSSCPQRFPQLIILRLKLKIFQTPVLIRGIDWRSNRAQVAYMGQARAKSSFQNLSNSILLSCWILWPSSRRYCTNNDARTHI